MEPKIEEVASRIRSLREDLDISMQEMAQATVARFRNTPRKNRASRI